jgi:hypothetical protein
VQTVNNGRCDQCGRSVKIPEELERLRGLLRDCQDALMALEESYPELMDRLAAELSSK